MTQLLRQGDPSLLVGSTAYDGDPNLGAAPTEIVNAKPGTRFVELTRNITWEKNAQGYWTTIINDTGNVFAPIIYVETTGDDTASGDISNPLATIDEATRRVSLYGMQKIIVGVGTWEMADYSVGAEQLGAGLLLHGGSRGVTLEGTLVANPSQATVTPTGWVDNVATVSETLTPGALVGSQMVVREFVVGGLDITFYRWIVANDATTVTIAYSVPGLGGSGTIDAGPRSIYDLGTVITGNATAPTSNTNRFNYSGNVKITAIHFDGSINATSYLLNSNDVASDLVVENCKFNDWTSRGVRALGNASFGTNWFEDMGRGVTVGYETNWSADNVAKNVTTKVISTNGVSDYINLGAGGVRWMFGTIGTYIGGRGGYIQDWTVGAWVDGTLATYVAMESTRGNYFKGNLGMKFIGPGTVTAYAKTLTGGQIYDFFDSSAAVMPSGNYIDDNGTVITLAEYNAGTGAATAVRRYNNDRGNFFFD